MAHILSADSGSARRGKPAWIRADGGGDAGERFVAECNGADEYANALFDGGGWLFAAGVCSEAPEIWHAVDRDSDFVRDLRAAGISHAGAVADRVHLAAEPGDRADGDGRVEAAEDAAGDAAAVSDSLGKHGTGVRGDRADPDDDCGASVQRQVCVEVGACARGPGRGVVLRLSDRQKMGGRLILWEPIAESRGLREICESCCALWSVWPCLGQFPARPP